jgi:hypothetical protein
MGPGVRRDDKRLRGGALAFLMFGAYIFFRFGGGADVRFRVQIRSGIGAGGALSWANGLRPNRGCDIFKLARRFP